MKSLCVNIIAPNSRSCNSKLLPTAGPVAFILPT